MRPKLFSFILISATVILSIGYVLLLIGIHAFRKREEDKRKRDIIVNIGSVMIGIALLGILIVSLSSIIISRQRVMEFLANTEDY